MLLSPNFFMTQSQFLLSSSDFFLLFLPLEISDKKPGVDGRDKLSK